MSGNFEIRFRFDRPRWWHRFVRRIVTWGGFTIEIVQRGRADGPARLTGYVATDGTLTTFVDVGGTTRLKATSQGEAH